MLHLLLPHSQPDRPLYVFRLQLRHPAPPFPASQRAHRSTGLLASAGAAVLCCAVRACGARCPAAQRCVPYYAALLRVCLHDYSSEVHEGFAPSPCNAWSVLPVLISFTSLRAIMDGIRHLPYVTYFTPPTAAVSPVVFNTPPYPVTARVCQSTRPYRTACYWHGYTDQLPPRLFLAGRYGSGFGTPNGRISCPNARSASCSAKSSSSSSPSSSSSSASASSSSSSFSSSALP